MTEKSLTGITLCSSSKFYADAAKLATALEVLGRPVYTPRFDFNEEVRPVSKQEKNFLTKDFLEKIRKSTHVYVVACHGYTGVSVCLEVGFAYGLGRTILASESPSEDAVAALVDNVVPANELAAYLAAQFGIQEEF